MRTLLLIMLISASIMHDRVAFGADPAPMIGRVTTSFDIRNTGPVLHRVSHLLSDGFKSDQVNSLLKEIEAMRTETPMAWHFSVIYKHRPHELQIRALVDDLGMIDLDFATDPELAAKIRVEVDGYLNRRN